MTRPVNEAAVRLAHVADQNGMWVHDVVRFEDLLQEADLDGKCVTRELVEEAHQLMMDGLGRLQRIIRKWNGDVNAQDNKDVNVVVLPRKKPVRAKGNVKPKIFGFSVTAVLRWMGANGWDFDDAAIAVETITVTKLSDVTIRLQLKAGRDGKRGAPADISPSQAKQLRAAAE